MSIAVDLLRDNPELRPFVLSNVTLTGTRIGAGAYGSVEEVAISVCGAAKKIHDIFQDRSEIPDEDISKASTQFVKECQLMSTLRHPNIVQFLGVCFFEGSRLPALVMERLLTSLHDLLAPESTRPPPGTPSPLSFFKLGLKCSVLHNVASGLDYLHHQDPPIIHRDLSARNILLNSRLVGKLADLGVARIVPRMRDAATMTKGPGALVYMPPEAIAPSPSNAEKSKYDASIDVFSLGVVTIFTVGETFPCDPLAPNYLDEDSGQLIALTELQRRSEYMRNVNTQLRACGQLRGDHPLIRLIQQCLNNSARKRPNIGEVLGLLGEARAGIRDEESERNKVELVRALQNQPRNQNLVQLIDELVIENAELQQQLMRKEAELTSAEEAIRREQQQMRQLEHTHRAKDRELQQQLRQQEDLQRQLQSSEALVADFQKALQQKDSELEALRTKSSSQAARSVSVPHSIPPSKQGKIEEDKREKKERSKKREEYEQSLCKFRLFARHPETGELMERKIEVPQDWNLPQTVQESHRLLELEDVVPVSRCRLVKYDEYTECLDQSFEENEGETFGQMVGGPRTFDLFLEIREENEVFKPYNTGGLNLKILVVDLASRKVRPPVQMRAEQGWTVLELKETIAKKLNLALSTMNLVLETYQNEGMHLAVDSHLLEKENLFKKHSVFACSDPEDFTKPFRESEIHKMIDAHLNSILLTITIPPPPQILAPDGEVDLTKDRPLQRTINLRIDQRNTLQDLKDRLVEYVQQPATNFKIYRRYSNNQEYEMFRLSDALTIVPNETRLVVRLGRAPLPGEVRVRLSLLRMGETKFFKPLMDSIITKGMSVHDFKKQIIKEAYNQGVEYPLQLDRFRLRKKTWQTASTVFLDYQIFEKEIHIFTNFEIYVEPLEGPEPMTSPSQIQVYLRKWHPATYTVDPPIEIILDESSPTHLKARIAEASGIPLEHVMFAKPCATFPCEISVLDLEDDLEWNPNVSSISSKPLSIYDDGAVLYFKDAREKHMNLTAEKRKEIQKQKRYGYL